MKGIEIVRELMACLSEAIDLEGGSLPTQRYKEAIDKAEKSIAEELCTEKELYEEAIETWGSMSQMDLMIEECSELTKAIQKLKRNSVVEKHMTLVDAVAEEVADVAIMCSVMALLVGEEAVQKVKVAKINRLRKLLG